MGVLRIVNDYIFHIGLMEVRLCMTLFVSFFSMGCVPQLMTNTKCSWLDTLNRAYCTHACKYQHTKRFV